ncbi:MAG: hypothetical protein ACI8ZM_000138 [Crocinitomix sp.]|jgi:hypothetical protein
MKFLLACSLLVSMFSFGQCSDIFFSEYIEGSSNNKAIEIYNPTGADIDLADYRIRLNANGAATPTSTYSPTGTLAAGDVFIIRNSSAALAEIIAEADATAAVASFNGDDALWIEKISTGDTLDIIGVIGEDPGSYWTVGIGRTQNYTLVRKLAVNEGQLDWVIGATEWEVFDINMVDSLGAHTITPCLVEDCNTAGSFEETACDSLVSPSGLYTWISTGMYMDTIPNIAGCDSVLNYDLTIVNATTASVEETACDSLVSPSGLYTWTSTGVYLDTLMNDAGCDSIITVDLTIVNATTASVEEIACDSLVSPSGLYTWTETGVYMDTITNEAGCDSIITVDLTIATATESSFEETACDSLISPSGLYTWTETGVYMDTLTNEAGCDSIITVGLTIAAATTASVEEITCDSYESPSGLFTWTESGEYVDTLTNEAGCDSIITIELIILETTFSEISETACESYVSPSALYTWTESGEYVDTLTNEAGCDSIITIDLTIPVIDVTVTQAENELTANNATATYQWLDCDADFAILDGETDQLFAAGFNGNYAVEITQDGCVDTSACYEVTGLSINKNAFEAGIVLYPNPTSSDFTVELGQATSGSIIVRNVMGQIVATTQFVNAQLIAVSIEGQTGSYFVEITTDANETARLKVIKF